MQQRPTRTSRIPRRPVLRMRTYDIPGMYKEAYETRGISNPDQQAMLFHATQFGGFRVKKLPRRADTKGFVPAWFKAEQDGGYIILKPNANFLAAFGWLDIEPLERRWKLQPVKEDEMYEYGYSVEEVFRAVDFLTKLNDFYSHLRIRINAPQSGMTVEDRVYLSSFHSIPFLRKKPKAGGRFFHPQSSYQRVSSVLRTFLTINDAPACEIDITAAVIQFFDIALREKCKKSIEDTILSREDPYQFFLETLNSEWFQEAFESKPIDREALKKVLYTAICSEANMQPSYVTHKLHRMGYKFKSTDLENLFPEFFKPLAELKSAAAMPLYRLLYRYESRFAEEVLQRGCLGEGIPIIPIHDSFITTHKNYEALARIIDEAAQSLYQRKLQYKRKY